MMLDTTIELQIAYKFIPFSEKFLSRATKYFYRAFVHTV